MKKLNSAAAIVVVLTAQGITGCKKAGEFHVIAAPPAQLEGGWNLATSRDKTVSVGVPSGWRAGVDTAMSGMPGMGNLPRMDAAPGGPSTDIGLNNQIQQMEQNMQADSQKEEQEKLAKLEKEGIIVNVINGSKPIPGEQRTRFYVKRVHDSPGSLDDAAEAERKHYGSKDKPTPVKLPIGPAFRITEDDSLRDGMTMHQISYVIVYDADTYLLRFESEEDISAIQQVAEPVAMSLRIVPAKRS